MVRESFSGSECSPIWLVPAQNGTQLFFWYTHDDPEEAVLARRFPALRGLRIAWWAPASTRGLRRGVIALPTGAGKSRIGAAAIAKAKLRRNFALDRLLRHQNAHIMRMMSYRLAMTVPKRPVNLSLNIDLVERARRLTDNLSAQVETLLAEFVERREQEQQAEAERLERATQAWNDFAERHGSFADEFSTL